MITVELNRFARKLHKLMIVPALCLGLSSYTQAANLALSEGWNSWEVPAVEGAPAWCCFDYNAGVVQARSCQLDRGSHGYGGNGQSSTSGSARIYALLEGGEVRKLRALDSQCAVSTDSTIHALGAVAADDSVNWLAQQLAPRSRLTDDALAAIALHAGDQAGQTLRRSAEAPNEIDTREHALFWMGQLHGLTFADYLQTTMRDDPSPQIRRHAAFSVSQSDAPNRVAALIEQGRNDRSAEVRSQAWFWLAQTEDPSAEAAIGAAMRNETDEEVRDQQVFALSQLPDQRAAQALIAIIGDRHQDTQVRKQALFWLGQSDSEEAYRYLDALLADR